MRFLVDISVIFVVVLVGAYTKEVIDITKKDREAQKIDLVKVLLTSTGVTIICYSANPLFIERYGKRSLILIHYLFGLSSYKILKYATIRLIKIMEFFHSEE